MKLVLVFLFLVLVGCTKPNSKPPVGPDGKPMISAEAGDQLVLSGVIELPAGLVKRVKKSDLLIWDVKDAGGELLAGSIGPVPSFPHELKVAARQLRKPVAQGAPLIFSVRVVKDEDASKPPKKGQLHANVGIGGSEEVVENPNVDPKRLEAWMKKNNIAPPQDLRVGGSARAELRPILF